MKHVKQKGGIVSGMLWFIIIIFLLVVGIQVTFAYISQQTIRNAVKTTLIEEKNNDNATVRMIENGISKKLSVNSIELSKDDIFVQKTGRSFVVDITYRKEIGVSDKFKLVMDLSFNEETPQ